jgi:HAD superfamily hydrolase (TIGR01509 family)
MSRSGHAASAAPPVLRAVAFDMDGLLVDSEPLWFQAESAVMARLQGSWAPEDQDALLGGSMATTVAYLLNKGTRPVAPAAVASWLLDAMVDLLRAAPPPVLPGAVELVEEVRAAGLPYALVTSSEPEVVEAILDHVDVQFPVVVCAADVARAKPDPEGYLLAAAKLGAEPGQCIALEDSVNGVQAAEAAGYRAVAVPSVIPVPARSGRVVLESLDGVTLAQLASRAGFAL